MKKNTILKCGLILATLLITQIYSIKLYSQISLNPEISRSRSLYDRADGNRYDGMNYSLGMGLKTDVGSFSSKLAYSQNLNDLSPEENDLNDTAVTYSMIPLEYDFLHNFDLKMIPSLTVVIPVSKNTRQNDKLHTAISAGLGYVLIPKNTPELSLSLGLSLGHNFHEFDRNESGEVLNKYSSNQSLATSLKLGDFSASLSFIHKNRWTYQSAMRESFEMSQDVSWNFSPQFYLGIAHTNAGSVIKPNGYESNIAFADDDNSVISIFAGGNFTF